MSGEEAGERSGPGPRPARGKRPGRRERAARGQASRDAGADRGGGGQDRGSGGPDRGGGQARGGPDRAGGPGHGQPPGRGPDRGPGGGPTRAGPARGRGRGGRESPRRRAAALVGQVLEGRGLAREHIDRAASGSGLSPDDVGLLTELVYGTVRRVATIDAVLDGLAKGGVGRVDEELLAHLRVATYQLLFLDRVPPAVAVSEAVEAAGAPHLRGFANGVLRAVGRAVLRRVAEEAPPDGVPWTRCLPGRDGGWVVLGRDLLPDATRDPASWLAAAASFPRSVAAAWIERSGLQGALQLARAHDSTPPIALRANVLRGGRDALIERLRAAGVEAAPGEPPAAIRLGGLLPAAARALVDEGLATVQDETAMRVAAFLEPRPGERVVDLCAAPGGKATHLAELMGDRGRVDALDVEAERLALVEASARRLGLTSVRCTLAVDGDPRPPADEAPIDRVLVDAPCSNTGVLRRRVEARWRLATIDWRALDDVQGRLLERALELVRPGGVVVYATCSIEPRENEARVRALLERRKDVALEAEAAVQPAVGGGDGGYMARLRRKAEGAEQLT